MNPLTSSFPVPPVRWVVDRPPADAVVRALSEGLGVAPALAALLARRGLESAEAARRFLRPALDALADPASLAGIPEAVDAITRAVRGGTGILVHGDYDVDGQCATAEHG
jgi:single-stranded-DNA-specific exonuclease